METKKLTKLEREFNEIVNNSKLSYPAKCKQLLAMETEKRQGAIIVRSNIEKFTEKYVEFCRTKIIYKGNINPAWRNKDWYPSKRKDSRVEVLDYYLYSYLENALSHVKKVYGYYLKLASTLRYKRFDANSYIAYLNHSKISRKSFNYKESKKIAYDFFKVAKPLFDNLKKEDDEIDAFCKETNLPPNYFKRQDTLSYFQDSRNNRLCYFKFRNYYIYSSDETEVDWSYYSKRYGHPKNTTHRFLHFCKPGMIEEIITIPRFAGQWVLNALAEKFNLQKRKVAKGLKDVQLNEYFDVNFLRKIGNINIYSVEFEGEVQYYCAKAKGLTYHDDNIYLAVNGLLKKIRANAEKKLEKIKQRDELLTAKELNKEYGFCFAGMESFANKIGIDVKGEHTLGSLIDLAKQNKIDNKYAYAKELKKVGII